MSKFNHFLIEFSRPRMIEFNLFLLKKKTSGWHPRRLSDRPHVPRRHLSVRVLQPHPGFVDRQSLGTSTLGCSKIGAPPPRLEILDFVKSTQISDLRVWGTGNIVDRVLKSVRDICKPSTAPADPIRDVSGIPES